MLVVDPVHTLESVGAEEIALRLDHVGGAARGAHHVEPDQTGRQGGQGMARADTNNTIDLLKEIKTKRDITMCIIEHDMHVVFSLADRITVLAQGTPLVEDTPQNIKGHPKVREAYLGEAQV